MNLIRQQRGASWRRKRGCRVAPLRQSYLRRRDRSFYPRITLLSPTYILLHQTTFPKEKARRLKHLWVMLHDQVCQRICLLMPFSFTSLIFNKWKLLKNLILDYEPQDIKKCGKSKETRCLEAKMTKG